MRVQCICGENELRDNCIPIYSAIYIILIVGAYRCRTMCGVRMRVKSLSARDVDDYYN